MAWLRHRQQLSPVEYLELDMPRWFDDPSPERTPEAADLQLANQWWTLLTQLPTPAFEDVMVHVRRYVDELLPVAAAFEGPTDPSLLSFHFSQGWLVADLETHQGAARHERSSRAAQITLSLLAASSPGGPAQQLLTVRQFLHAGYYVRRKGAPTSPAAPSAESLAMAVRIDGRSSLMDADKRFKQERQQQAGRAWLAEQAAEKEMRRMARWKAHGTDGLRP
jgi:hypothetical protein